MRVVVESAANPFRVADSSSAQNRPEADLPNELDLDMFRDDLPDVAPEAISVDFDELIGEQRSVELGVVTEALVQFRSVVNRYANAMVTTDANACAVDRVGLTREGGSRRGSRL